MEVEDEVGRRRVSRRRAPPLIGTTSLVSLSLSVRVSESARDCVVWMRKREGGREVIDRAAASTAAPERGPHPFSLLLRRTVSLSWMWAPPGPTTSRKESAARDSPLPSSLFIYTHTHPSQHIVPLLNFS